MTALRKTSGIAPAVRVSTSTHEKLQELAQQENRAMGEIVTDLVDEYRKRKFWEDVNSALDRLHADSDAWDDYMDDLGQVQSSPNTELAAEPPYAFEEEIRGEPARSTSR